MTEITRLLLYPRVSAEGLWLGSSMLTPKAMKTRGELLIPPLPTIPVIVVPGIMGTNLCATTDPHKEKNRELAPGEAAWRPPNGLVDGYTEIGKWQERTPKQRQRILDPATLDVDGGGDVDLSDTILKSGFDDARARERWWGEVHWGSYGKLICALEYNLNTTFWFPTASARSTGQRQLQPHWRAVNGWERKDWGAAATGITAPLTEAELEKHARFKYPVYACGYNWLLSSEESARRLQQRIQEIIHFWSSREHPCKQVILVTHSMGGLVARACAKQIPELIAGVIHGVMPVLGAPVCYRRIACGTEGAQPGMGYIATKKAEGFAIIAGRTAAETTPVLATAPGPLELLPNHLYPRPWLFATCQWSSARDMDMLRLPTGNPYDLYRDTRSWYRMINPALADPANKRNGDIKRFILDAVNQAEKFHTKILDTYYHPNTYAFYGDDHGHLSYGRIRWMTFALPAAASQSLMQNARLKSASLSGVREVTYDGGSNGFYELAAEPESAGDGTVPGPSGAAAVGKVKQLFRTQGYDHQGCYGNDAMLALTQHLIVKIGQVVT